MAWVKVITRGKGDSVSAASAVRGSWAELLAAQMRVQSSRDASMGNPSALDAQLCHARSQVFEAATVERRW